MHRKGPLTPTHEMYLKELKQLGGPDRPARVRDLAESLGVSAGTVSAALKKLQRDRLVRHERYGMISLTRRGLRVAECVMHRFETMRDVLVEIFGVDPATAEVDACMMEHAVSPATVNRMEAMLARVRAGGPPPAGGVPGAPRAAADEPTCRECEAAGECRAAADADREAERA